MKLRVFGGCAATAGIVTLVGGFTTVAVARTSVGMLAPPMIEGTPYKGSVLTCVSAEPRDPALVGWLWRRDGVQIPDATTQTYVVAGTDVGHRVGCAETVTESGATNIASSVEVEIILVSVRIVSDTRGVQSGPTLTLRGAIVADGPAAAGMLLLITLHGSKGVTVAREPVQTDGRFSLSKTVWGLVPGRYPFRIEFVPADPELHQPAQQLVAVTATSPSTYPFARTVADRRPTIFDGLTPFWSDGRSCSVGCVPRGALQGWPLEPFHEQHPLRAGLNELRPSGFHVGVDIMAFENQKVYAIQSGYAHVIQPRGIEARVRVGSYIYWHVKISVREGQYVRAYHPVIGRVFGYYVRHLHLSEVDTTGRYLNPLRPGGRILAPWHDFEPPVIGRPIVSGDGDVIVDAFDPQSYVRTIYYPTPVLAPAALAYRLFSAAGTPESPLVWALRGSQWLPPSLVSSVFAPSAHGPGFTCFATRPLCIPRWRYRLAGGLAPRLPLAALHTRFRLTVYAWDWAGNVTARDTWIHA